MKLALSICWPSWGQRSWMYQEPSSTIRRDDVVAGETLADSPLPQAPTINAKARKRKNWRTIGATHRALDWRAMSQVAPRP